MNVEELKKLKAKAARQIALREGKKKYRVMAGMGTSGIAAGARAVMRAMLDEIEKRDLTDVEVRVVATLDVKDIEPAIQVEEADGQVTTYGSLTPEKVRKIVAEHLAKGKVVGSLAVSRTKGKK